MLVNIILPLQIWNKLSFLIVTLNFYFLEPVTSLWEGKWSLRQAAVIVLISTLNQASGHP
jgi:hypothetical protein